MAYFIAPISLGLGDLVVSLPVIQAMIDMSGEVYLVSRDKAQSELATRIKGLAGVVLESDFDLKSLSNKDSYINMREHPLQKEFWWGSAVFDIVYPGYKINDLLKIISKDFGIQADFDKLQSLPYKSINEVKDKIVFVPGSDSEYKYWPKNNWLSLAATLKDYGVSVIVLGQPESSRAVKELVSELKWVPTPTIVDALDLISSAKAVIAVDTGLMHLAVHQGLPTIALYRSYPIYERKYARNFNLSARSCDARCIQQSSGYTYSSVTNFNDFIYKSWQCQAEPGEFCMNSILCDNVIGIIERHSDLFLNQSLECI